MRKLVSVVGTAVGCALAAMAVFALIPFILCGELFRSIVIWFAGPEKNAPDDAYWYRGHEEERDESIISSVRRLYWQPTSTSPFSKATPRLQP